MSDVIIIEKLLEDNSSLRMHYSECVNEATIKIIRRSKPNLKWKVQATYKADLPYEVFREVAQKFVFEKHTDMDVIVDFIESQVKEQTNEK